MRPPDLIIGPRDNPQTLRWVLFNWRGYQLCLHKWLRSDDDRALHDHKSNNFSFILSPQGFRELVREPDPYGGYMDYWWDRSAWAFNYRKAETPHRVALHDGRPVWSLWFRWPPRRRWGFWCPKGWVDADEFLASKGDYYVDGVSEKGRGCG